MLPIFKESPLCSQSPPFWGLKQPYVIRDLTWPSQSEMETVLRKLLLRKRSNSFQRPKLTHNRKILSNAWRHLTLTCLNPRHERTLIGGIAIGTFEAIWQPAPHTKRARTLRCE